MFIDNPRSHSVQRRQQAMTLVELMVSMSIFAILGGSLVLFLRVGLDTWRTGEMRREAFERAQAVLDQVESDLSCTFSDPSNGYGNKVEVMFLSDYDAAGQQRLRFVRTLAGEMRNPITQQAGSLTGGAGELDYFNDKFEMEQGLLRAPGGLQEVCYMLDLRPGNYMLWRGVKSPIGSYTTLFDEGNLYRYQAGDTEAQVEFGEEAKLAGIVPRRARALAAGILYMEMNFWGQDTDSWQRDPGKRGAQTWWDSTRAIIEPSDLDEGDSRFFNPDSRHEWRDDVFPSRVHIILVLRPSRVVGLARLTQSLSATDDEIFVSRSDGYPEGAFQFAKIGDEWIRYESKDGRRFVGVRRGQRGTEPQDHAVGTPLIYGTTFSRVIRIPGARSSKWGR